MRRPDPPLSYFITATFRLPRFQYATLMLYCIYRQQYIHIHTYIYSNIGVYTPLFGQPGSRARRRPPPPPPPPGPPPPPRGRAGERGGRRAGGGERQTARARPVWRPPARDPRLGSGRARAGSWAAPCGGGHRGGEGPPGRRAARWKRQGDRVRPGLRDQPGPPVDRSTTAAGSCPSLMLRSREGERGRTGDRARSSAQWTQSS